MVDKLVVGTIAGATAGAVIDAVNAINYYVLNVTTLRNLDWAAIIVYGHPPRTPIETGLAEVWHLVWTALLGILFVYGRGILSTRHPLYRGIVYGAVTWMMIYTFTLLFKVPYVRIIAWKTALSNFALAIIFGLVLGYVTERLDHTGKTGRSR
jgi:hypothetical protein